MTTAQADLEYFPPTAPHGESRSATLERIVHDEHLDRGPEPLEADLTTATGGNRRIARDALIGALIGLIVGAGAGLALSWLPGPGDSLASSGHIGLAIVLGIVGAVAVGLVTTLLQLAREDGRSAHPPAEPER